MSNGLADASFFPTAKELSTGLRWFKDHPVLAAAAATAVSVITYLNATESLAPSRSSSAASVLDEAEDERDSDGDEDATGAFQDGGSSGGGGGGSSGGALYQKREVGVVVTRRKVEVESVSGDKITVTDTIATTTTNQAVATGSDGKLSAAVSWCDEHGGSLTQVFGDLERAERDGRLLTTESDNTRAAPSPRVETLRSGTASTATDRDARICDTNRHVTASSRPVGEGTPVIRKSSTQQSILSAMSSSDPLATGDVQHRQQPGGSSMTGEGGDVDLQTESPQWGWYVAITPPQDHFYSNLPRATPQPYRALYPGSNNARVSNAAANNSTLRRSISGKIS